MSYHASNGFRSVVRSVTAPDKFGRIGVIVFVLLLAPQMAAQSPLDGFDPNANGDIRVAIVQPDGKILIGGDFTTLAPNGGPTFTRNYIARLNPDGKLDPALFFPNPNGPVFSIAVQTDGKILIGGTFTSCGGQPRNNIARVDPVTSAPDSFNPDATGDNYVAVQTITLQGDGKILVGGAFNQIGGQQRNNIARLDPGTGLAEPWDPNSNFYVRAIVPQADGKILVAGDFGEIGGKARDNIARLDPITGLADSFDPQARPIPGFNNYVASIAVQPDRKILVGGFFGAIGSQIRNRIARLDPNTGLADSFDPNIVYTQQDFAGAVNTIVVQPNGKILVGGYFDQVGGQLRNHIARLDPVTALPDSLDANMPSSASLSSIGLQADGKILAVGAFHSVGGKTRNHIARLEADGRLDQTLDINVEPTTNDRAVRTTAIQPDGKILIGGAFTSILGVPRNNIARLNTDGTLDMTFDPNAIDGSDGATVYSIVLQADGKILVGGHFSSIGGQPRENIARLDSATGLADSFDPGSGGWVFAIALQADGKILLGKTFGLIGGVGRSGMARLDPVTGLPDSFEPSSNAYCTTVAVQPDGMILVGGYFSQIGGQVRNAAARLDPSSGLADSFNPRPNNLVHTIVIESSGKILIGGEFDQIAGQGQWGLARLDPITGALDHSFQPTTTSAVISSIVEQADGKLFVGGYFYNLNGQKRQGLARLDSGTGLADSFNANLDGIVYSLALQSDGKVLVGGRFGTVDGQPRNSFARLANDTSARESIAATQDTVTWTREGTSQRFTNATFEYSTDNVNYVPLGDATASGDNWTLPGLHFPFEQNVYVRARGYFRTGGYNAAVSITESIKNVFIRRPSTLANISTRLRVQTDDQAMIGGFIITGTQPKTVIVRGLGPSIPVPDALNDPVIEVHGDDGQLLATNDNWMDADSRQQIIDSGLAPNSDLESALWGIINPGPYTVVLRGKNNSTGVGLFEVYDLDRTADSKLANVSTRGFVQVSNGVMIGGTIIVGDNPARVLIRAIGPSLAAFGVTDALHNPSLELYDSNGALTDSNDDWRSDHEAEIIATGIPPTNDLESAIILDLAPGSYTAIVRGVSNTAGVAVVEAYELN